MNTAILWTFPMVSTAAGGIAFGFHILNTFGQLAWVLTLRPETNGVSLERIQKEFGID